MNTQSSPVSRGGLSSTLAATTGGYSTVAVRDISQTNEDAPAAEACLLNRFQVAWAAAATRMRATAVALTGRLQGRAPGTADGARGHGELRALEVSIPSGVGAEGAWRRSVQPAPP